jgi:hypothetical protein
MMITKNYKLLPAGHIAGGTLDYTLDTTSGLVVWSAVASLQVWGIRVYTFSQQNQKMTIDVNQLLTSGFKVGQILSFGPVMVQVLSIVAGKTAMAKVTVADNADSVNTVGVATFDMSGEYVSLVEIEETGSAKGFGVNVTIQED